MSIEQHGAGQDYARTFDLSIAQASSEQRAGLKQTQIEQQYREHLDSLHRLQAIWSNANADLNHQLAAQYIEMVGRYEDSMVKRLSGDMKDYRYAGVDWQPIFKLLGEAGMTLDDAKETTLALHYEREPGTVPLDEAIVPTEDDSAAIAAARASLASFAAEPAVPPISDAQLETDRT